MSFALPFVPTFAPPFDPLLLLLDDPALLAALLAPPEPALAAAMPAAAPAALPPPPAPPAPPAPPEPPVTFTADAFPTIEELDALLAESRQATAGPDLASRQDLAAMLGLDPGLAADEAAFLAALAALEPPPPEEVPDLLSGATPGDPAWSEPAREDWPLG